jgi:hypothetical protein
LLPVFVQAEAGAVVTLASFAAGTLGGNDALGARNFSHTSTGAVTDTAAETAIVAYRNKTTYAGISNPVPARLLYPGFASVHDGIIRVSFRLGPTFSGSPTWTSVNASDSIIEYSTNAVLSSAGTRGPSFFISGGKQVSDSLAIDFSRAGLELYPGDVCAITCERLTGTGNYTVFQTQTWEELF